MEFQMNTPVLWNPNILMFDTFTIISNSLQSLPTLRALLGQGKCCLLTLSDTLQTQEIYNKYDETDENYKTE